MQNNRQVELSKLVVQAEKAILLWFSSLEKKINAIVESGTYLIQTQKDEILGKIDDLQKELEKCASNGFLSLDFINSINAKLNDQRQYLVSYNRVFVNQRKKEYSYFWKKDNIVLDDEQQTAIVTDDKYNLVVAAAGSGKTEVLITRIAYLIQRKPDSIEPKSHPRA